MKAWRWFKKNWKLITLSASLVIVVSIGSYMWWLYDSLAGMNKGGDSPLLPQVAAQPQDSDKPAVTLPPEPPKWEGKERVNILLLGADARGLQEQESPRTDTILLASIDPETKKATLMSILRDTYVSIPAHGKQRINAALPLGGPNLTMQTLSEWTGLDIQYYIYTDFQGFIKLIDALGGIEFEVEKDMYYTSKADGSAYDINLKKGLQMLDGESALQYVRFRYDALSDYSRTKRQRELLTAVAEEMKSAWSILQLPHLINQISPYVDTNLTVDDMIKLGALGLGVKIEPNLQLPPPELLQETNIGGDEVITVTSTEELQAFIRDTLEGQKENSDSENPVSAP